MQANNGTLTVRTGLPNPRPNTAPMGFVVGYDNSDQPIKVAFDLPYSGTFDYFINLSWEEWQGINAWLQTKLVEGLRSE